MPSSAIELTTVTVCLPASVVSCSRGCKPSRMPLPVSSLGPEDLNMSCNTDTVSLHWLSIWQRILFKTAVLVYKCRHGILRHLTYRHAASQRHYTTAGVTFALPYLDNYLFHA